MRVFDVEVNFGDVYEDLIVKEASAGKLGNYTAMLCTCRLCGEDNLYKKSEVLAGKVKRCQQCNKNRKVKKSECVVCAEVFEKRAMCNSKRFGLVCQQCYKNSTLKQCAECTEVVDISNGNHSGYCDTHWKIHRTAYSLVASSKHRAKIHNLKYDLDIDWVKGRLTVCNVTGIPFNIPDHFKGEKQPGNYSNRHPLTPSIDRIDFKGGYTKENCQVVCWWYNLSKSTWETGVVEDIVSRWMKYKESSFNG